MHRLILIAALSLFSCTALIPATAHAQASGTEKVKKPDGSVMMKGGKMMVRTNGKWTPMTRNVTMSNGSVIDIRGSVSTKDGRKSMLKDGDSVAPDGTVSKKMVQ